MAKKKYQPNQAKRIVIMIFLMRGSESLAYKSCEYDINTDIIQYKDIKDICQQFLKQEGIQYQTNIYIPDTQNLEGRIVLYNTYQVNVQQIIQKMNGSLILIIKGVIDELKQNFQSQIDQLKMEIQQMRLEMDLIKKPLKDNLQLLRKNSVSPLPLMLPAHSHISQIQKQSEYIELDIAILFSEPLYDEEKKKITAPAVDFRSEISRLNLALQNSFKPTIIMRCEIATFQSLQTIIKYSKPKIMHIICHGNSQGNLQFEDDSRNTLGLLQLLKPSDIKNVLKAEKQILPSLVFINSCHSEEVGKAFYQLGVPNVVMINSEDPVIDEAAQIFSENFYRKIFKGTTVNQAFQYSKERVQIKHASGMCCCSHSLTLQPHRPECQWVKLQKKEPLQSHRIYHVPSSKCECELKNLNRHSVQCQWARKSLFQINKDFRIPIEGTNQFRFPSIISQFPDYFDRQKKQLNICCCPVKGRKPHSQSNKFKILSKDEGKKILMPVAHNRDHPEVTDLTSIELLQAHEKSKAIFGRQRELFEFLKQIKDVNFTYVYGKTGVGLTTFTVKASTYMMQRRVFQFFFFIDLYDIKDQIVFRYKFNEVTKFQYNGRSINEFGMKNRKILLLFDNCDSFIDKDAEKFYQQIRTLLREIPRGKIIITFKQQSKPNFDQKKIIGQKYELLPFQFRHAVFFFNSKMKDKTDISVGVKEIRSLVTKYEVLRIPKVIQSISQSFPITQKRVTLAEIQKNVEGIKLSDTNQLTKSVLNQLNQRSHQAYQFLVFVSQFSDGVTFEDINIFSTYFRKDMSIQLPIKKNWQDHYLILFEKDQKIIKKEGSGSLSPPKFEAAISQTDQLTPFIQIAGKNIDLKKKQSEAGTISSQLIKNQFEELDKIKGQSYFIDKNGPGRFIVKRFIRDFLWKKSQNQTTNQIKFLFVAYFSVILEMLFETLKQTNFIHEDLASYSAISSSGIFSFKTTLEAIYEKRILTQSVRFAKQFIIDLDVIFTKNEFLQQKMKKTDHSTFIMNHRQDFLKFYDTKWLEVFNHLKNRNKGEQKIFVILLQNLMIYIPTAFKIANAEPTLLKYVLRGSERELKKLKTVTSQERNLKLQLKLCFLEIGISLENETEVKSLLGNGLKIIKQAASVYESKGIENREFEDIKIIFYEEQFLCDLLMDDKNLKMQHMNDLNHLVNRKIDFLSNQEAVNLEPLIKAKQGLMISCLFLKFLMKNPVDLSIFLTKRGQNQNYDPSSDLTRNILQICDKSRITFDEKKCLKLKLKAELVAIQLFWEMNEKLKSNKMDDIKSEDIQFWRSRLSECEKQFYHQKNKLRGFTEFDDKIKQLKQKIKEKLWMNASKKMIFMKAYPLSSKDYPIIKNLIRKKNNYRQQIEKIFLNFQPKEKEHTTLERITGFSPALKQKESRLNPGQKRTLDISTKYEILTREKITEEAKARCSIMFINVDVRAQNDQLYFICENQMMQEQLVELNRQFVSHFNMDNMMILVLTGINTRKAMIKICELNKNPPIIIALNSDPIQNYDQIDYGHHMDSDFIISLIKRENQIKQAEIFYTKQFIRRITVSKIESNEEVRKLHEEAVKRMTIQISSQRVTPFIQTSRCKKNIHLQYNEGIYRDLSPGYEGNHNIDSKSYQSGLSIRRWRKMLEFFSYLCVDKVKKQTIQNLNPETRKKVLFLAPPKEEPQQIVDKPATFINIYGENGCGKTYFIREIAKILVQRQFYDFGVFLFEGKKIQKNFNGDFEAYIKIGASNGKMPVLEDFEKLLGDKTILIIDDFHMIKPRVNARMKIFLDKVIARKVNLVLVSLNQLKVDYLPNMKKIKLGSLDSMELEIFGYNMINIQNEDETKALSEMMKQAKNQNRPVSIKQITDFIQKMRRYRNHHLYHQETTAEQLENTMKKSNTTYG